MEILTNKYPFKININAYVYTDKKEGYKAQMNS